MITRLNILFFLLLSTSILILSKPHSRYSRSKRGTRFVQSDMISISISNFLTAPGPSPSSGCFYDTASNFIDEINYMLQTYEDDSSLRKILTSEGSQELLNKATQFGRLKAKATTPTDDAVYTLTIEDKTIISSEIFKELSNKQSESLTAEDVDNIFNDVLKNSWTTYATDKDYDEVKVNKMWMYARFKFASEYLQNAYSDYLDSCLPVNPHIQSILELIVLGLNEKSPLNEQEISNKVKLDPNGFDHGGYALSFWIQEENFDLVEPITYMQGFINNIETFKFHLECCRINHMFTIGGEKYEFRTSPTCTEYAFVMVSFERKYDNTYQFKGVIRLAHSNLRYEVTSTTPILAEHIENLQISLPNSRVKNPTFFTHFTDSSHNELRVLSHMTSSFYPVIDITNHKCIYSDNFSDEPCLYYSIGEECRACKEGYYLFDGVCYQQCPGGTVEYEGIMCKICTDNCERCLDIDTCDECEPPYGLYKGECYDPCPIGMFNNNGQCENCGVGGCLHCTDKFTCGECLPPKFLCGNKCVDTLPSGTYPIDEKTCGLCKDECEECSAYDICKKCRDGYFLFEERICLASCPYGFRNDHNSRKCIPCISHCKRCSVDGQCDECYEEYVLLDNRECGLSCPTGQVPFKGVCIPCTHQDTCAVCDANNVDNCIDCITPYVLLPNKTCGADCGFYYYPDDNNVCQPCQRSDCMMCKSDGTCIQCKPGKYLFNNNIDCVYPCPDGYIEDGDVCTKCDSNCRKCLLDNKSTCTACYYPDYLLREGTCVEKECGDYYYQNKETCEHCIEGCLECTNSYSCKYCDVVNGYYFKDGICVEDCGEGYRMNKQGYCEKCDVSYCGVCKSSSATCDACVESYVLYNNICYQSECPRMSYLSPDQPGKCKSCPMYCDKCINNEICVECTKPKVLQGSLCKDKCDDRFYNDDGICKECSNKRCKRCDVHDDKCSLCEDDEYYYNGDCVTTCPTGTFVNENRICQPCNPKCASCISHEDNCLSCNEPYIYDPDGIDDKCVTECEEGEIKIEGECVECEDKARCRKCTQDTKCCIAPKNGFYVYDCEIHETCPLGTYAYHNNTCLPCIEGCERCNSTSPLQCEQCEYGYYLYITNTNNNVCIRKCPEGYIEHERKCLKCGMYCSKCKHDNTQCCTVCPHGKYKQNCNCVDDCSYGYYADNGECHKCHETNCAICSKKGKHCEKCNDNYVLLNGKCHLAPCPEGYTNKDGICHKCDIEHCSICDVTTTECDYCTYPYIKVNDHQCNMECPSGTFIHPFTHLPNYTYCEKCPLNCQTCLNEHECSICTNGYALYNKQCVETCPTGYYKKQVDNGLLICETCPIANCGKCTEHDCLECKVDYYLQDNTSIDPQSKDMCYRTCPEGTYTDNHKRMCIQCPLHCKTCTDLHTCTACYSPYVLNKHECTENCPDGTVNINGTCKLCSNTCEYCKLCKDDLTTCVKCIGAKKLKNQKCVDTCGDYYYDRDGICYPCLDNCKQCENGKSCKWCNDGYYLHNQHCVRPCPEGYFASNGKCIQCGNNCKQCNNSEQCKVCYDKFVIVNGECREPPCPAGYYMKNVRECGSCSSKCIRCESYDKCEVCAEGFYLWKGFCVDTCPSGTLPLNGACVHCVDHCNKCGASINECIDCVDKYYLHDKHCVDKCPAYYYADKESKMCKRCEAHCVECDDNSICKRCGADYYLYNNDCVSECPSGYSPFNGVCMKCTVEQCQHCTKDKDICDECIYGYFLYDNSCVTTCPNGTYVDYERQRCEKCKKECELCYDGETCSKCIEPYVLHLPGECYDDCHVGYVPVNGNCTECEVEYCDTCNPNKLTECVICQEPYYVKETNKGYSCVEECGDRYYVKLGRCEECEDNCLSCTDSNTCTSCVPPYVLYNASCYEQCPKYYVVTTTNSNNNNTTALTTVTSSLVCEKCKGKGCLNCLGTNITHCTHCELPYKLLNTQCVDKCPIGYFEVTYADRAECISCPYQCETCHNHEICQKCLPGYTLFEGHCITPPCPLGHVDIEGYCQMCSEHCSECSPSDPSICITCIDGFDLWDTDNTCIKPCPPHYTSIAGKCVKCVDDNCIQCTSNIEQCEPGGCVKPMLVLNGKCVERCPDGYYELDHVCNKCDDVKHCKECYPLDPSRCKKCHPEYPLYKYKCQPNGKCPDGWFIDSNYECQPCSSHCMQCDSIKRCNKCFEPFYLDTYGNCVECDKPGEVKVNNECKRCIGEACITCRSDDLNYCELCEAVNVTYNGKCLAECPTGTFIKGRNCVDCENNCDTCYDAQICLQCSSGYVEYKHDCLQQCPKGYVNINGHCIECATKYCDVCDVNNLTQCITCDKEHSILYEHKCYNKCPIRTYYDNSVNTCKPCITGCLTCLNDTTCESCDLEHWRYPDDKLCYTECPATTYVNSTVLECYNCPSDNCKHCCPNNPSLCLECLDGYLEYFDNEGYRHCVTTCPRGYYRYKHTNTCYKCGINCDECIDYNNCTNCVEPYVLHDNKCYNEVCPIGTVEHDDVCYTCKQHGTCRKCPYEDLSTCIECNEPYVLYGSECVRECPPHHYKHKDGNIERCIPCADGCDICNEHNCTKCLNGLYFYEYSNDCIQCKLPSQPINDTCKECSVEGCQFCVDGDTTTCKVCKDGFYYLNGECVVTCVAPYFEDGIKCTQCMEHCLQCNSIDKCEQCETPFVLLEGKCVDKCPEHYRKNTLNNVCERCQNAYCVECNERVDKCTKCERLGYGPYYLYKNTCEYECPIGTGVFDEQCVECPEHCTRCYGSVCDECISGKYLHDDKCVSTCPLQFYIRDNKYCTRCNEDDCISCPNNVCVECMEGSFLNETTHTCGKCSDGYYGNTSTKKCAKCSAFCKHCINDATCIECYDQYSFYNDICVKPCPDGYTTVDGRCVPCTSSDCGKCAQNEPDTCLWCKHGYKHKGYCLRECPIGYYGVTLNDHKECYKCNAFCDKCINDTYCVDCKDNFVLLKNNTCNVDCPPYHARVGDKCEPCIQDTCLRCAIDLEECYECERGLYLYNHKCISTCPYGYYANDKLKQCVPCDDTCEHCTATSCELCKRNYYKHEGVCLSSCPDGFYEDCDETKRQCVTCDSACRTCYAGSNAACIECNEGYFMNNGMCVTSLSCEHGTYFNGTTCRSCDVAYCAMCTSHGTCDVCNRGFTLNDNNTQCVELHELTHLINDYITVNEYTSSHDDIRERNELYMSSKYNGTGVGRSVITYSFYLRSLQPYLNNDVTVFTTVNPSGSAYNMKFVIDANDNQQCKLIITDEASVTYTITVCDCSYNALYEWKFFMLTLTKHGMNFIAKANTFDVDNMQLIEKTVHVEGRARTVVLDSNSYVLLNNNYNMAHTSNAAFQIGKLNVMAFYPSKEQIAQLYMYKPSTCDYFCTTCNDICLACPNGVIPTDNRCPAHYIYEQPELFVNPTETKLHLRTFLNGNALTSDAYGFTQWFYINDNTQQQQQGDEAYTLCKINFAGSNSGDKAYVNVQIVNDRIVFNDEALDHEPFETKHWYFIVITYTKALTQVMLRDKDGYAYTYNVNNFTFIRQHEDFIYTTHINPSTTSPYVTSVLNTKIYLNNIPSTKDINVDMSKLVCTANCNACDEQFKCLSCVDGFIVEDGVCIENSPNETDYIELINIYDLWNTDYKAFTMEFKENITIAFNLRKKTHSNIYNDYKKYSILSYSNGYSSKALLTETFVSEFISEYALYTEDGVKTWKHDYTDEVTDYITVVIMLNKYSETLTYIVNDYSIQHTLKFNGEFTDVIAKLIVGDSKGYEMNTEITNLRVYDGLAGSSLQRSLTLYPNACKGNCEKCDYSSGLCLTCAFDSKSMPPRECGKVSYSWYPAYLFGYNDWTFTGNHKFYVKNYHTNGINAETYSLYGLFQMFRLIEGNRYRVTCVNNDELKAFRPQHNRGYEVLCLDVVVQEGSARLILRVLDGTEYVYVPIKNLNFNNKDWISLNANVDVKAKLLRYDFMKNNNETTITHGEYVYAHVPEKIQKSASITVHGANDNIDKKVYAVPHINDYQIALIPHDVYNASSILKTQALLVQPQCVEGCDACVWDVSRTKGLCFECMQGYDKKYTTQGSAQVTCIKSKDKAIVFKGDIVVSTTEYVVPKNMQSSEQWSLYFQVLFNFGFWKFTSTTNVLTAGDIVVAVKNGKLYVIVANKDTVEIPLHDQYKTWNHVMLSKINSQLKVTVNAGSYVKELAIKSSSTSLTAINTIKLRPVGYFISFYATSYTTSVNIDFIKQREPIGYDKCGVDCAYCDNGVCKVCGNGYNVDGVTCKSRAMTLMPGYYAPEDGILTLKYLIDTDIVDRFIRIKNWSFQFTIEYDKMLSSDANFFTLLNYNGIDSVTSTINMQKGSLLFKLWPINTYESKSHEEVTLQLPQAPQNAFYYVGVAYDMDKNEFRVVFGENTDNVIERAYKVKGFLGYFGIEASALMYGTVHATIADIEYDYTTALTLEQMKRKFMKVTRRIQNDCINGTPTKCAQCASGTLSNGLCVPSSTTSTLLTQFREHYQVNPYSNNKVYKTSMNAFSSFTLMFMFRLNSLTKSNINLLKLSSTTLNDVLTVDYVPSSDTMMLSFYQIYQRISAGPVYKKNGNALEWVTFAMAYDIVKGSLNVKIIDTNDNIVFKGNSVLPTGKTYPTDVYVVNVGYNDVLLGSFEFTALELFDRVLNDNEIHLFKFNSLRKTKYGCKTIVNGVCNSKLENEIVLTSKAQTSKSSELFFTLYNNDNDKYYTFDKYLITLEVDINMFNSGQYIANPSTLFVFTEDITEETIALDKAQPIPKSALNAGLSLSLEGNALIIRAPNLPWNYNEQQTFALRFSDVSFKANVVVHVLGDVEENKISLLVQYDGSSYFYDVSYNNGSQRVPLIGFATLVYGHPALKYLSVNFNSPRLDYNALRYAKGVKNSCVVGMKGTYCPKCVNGFGVFKPVCNTVTLDQSTLHDQ